MVIVGTKCEESALVEMLFSWCCLWLCPITSPAVHEAVKYATMAEQRATSRYLRKSLMPSFILIAAFIFFLFLLSVSFQVLGETVPFPPIPDF